MSQTSLPYGHPLAITRQSAGLFAANMGRNTTINRLTGQMPMQSAAESTLRQQSSSDYPVVLCKDLSKTAGDEITFDLINPLGGIPIMGDAVAEGQGRALSFSQDKLRINQSRYPVSAGGAMTQQRTRWQLRTLARAAGESYMNRLVDQLTIVHMAGARGFHNNIEWAVPLASHTKFSEICVNTVKAPTRNRHFMSTGSGIESFAAANNEVSIATTDVLNMDVVDGIRAYIDSMPLPPSPVIFEGDKMAGDSPLRVLLVSAEQYASFIQTGAFRTLQAQAMQRAQAANGHPIFMGEAGLWNGILIVKMPKPIRFYAGDAIKHCASYLTETETTTDLVPAAFGTTFAVDRAILLGGQAVAYALGLNNKTGNPFFWSEKELDHGNNLEVLIGMMNGLSKIRFLIDHGETLGEQYTDNGVMVIDTSVKLAGQ